MEEFSHPNQPTISSHMQGYVSPITSHLPRKELILQNVVYFEDPISFLQMNLMLETGTVLCLVLASYLVLL